MKIAICDDVSQDADKIDNYLQIYSKDRGIAIETYSFTSSRELLKSKIKFDVAVLDILIDEWNGLDIGKLLKAKNPHICIMFVTGYNCYLDDAMNINAIRYLDKPVNPERLYSGLDNIIERSTNSRIAFTKANEGSKAFVKIRNIIYVEIEKRHTKLVTTEGTFHTAEVFEFWEKSLNGAAFARPHKSYIVNFEFIKEYKNRKLIMSDDTVITVTKSRSDEFNKKFFKYFK